MTTNPHYQSEYSYLDARYDQIIYLNSQTKLSSADFDEAYLLATVYYDKKQYTEAKNLLKISFDNKHTLPAGITYINTLKALGDKKKAHDVYEILSVLYAKNEIQDQEKIFQAR